MTKYQSIKLSGFLMIITGIFLLASPFVPSEAIQFTVGGLMMLIAGSALFSAYKSRSIQLPFKYHEMHAVGLAMYGLVILIFATNITKFINITTCFFIYYGTAELIFCFQLLNQRAKLNLVMIFVRSFMAVSIYFATLFIINSSGIHQNRSLQICGIMFIFSAMNMFLYNVILQKFEIPTGSSRTV
ncbi:MAG TPA: hypothetical protein VNB90_00930 [Cytophagaceae bacterium]|jgi:uncharacterized membrane protein HdeD (DUF308 family)|nr:hypothetical protein [Cytophagaceae bacterium]